MSLSLSPYLWWDLRAHVTGNDAQHNDSQHKLLICDTRHKNTAILLSVVMLSVAFYLLLCWVLLCWVPHFIFLLCWLLLCWVPLCWVSWSRFESWILELWVKCCTIVLPLHSLNVTFYAIKNNLFFHFLASVACSIDMNIVNDGSSVISNGALTIAIFARDFALS